MENVQMKLIKEKVTYNDKTWYNVYLVIGDKKVLIVAPPFKRKDGTKDYTNEAILKMFAETVNK